MLVFFFSSLFLASNEPSQKRAPKAQHVLSFSQVTLIKSTQLNWPPNITEVRFLLNNRLFTSVQCFKTQFTKTDS